MENKIETTSILSVIGIILVSLANIYKNIWLFYTFAVISLIVFIITAAMVRQFKKLPVDAPEHKKTNEKSSTGFS